MDFIEKWFGVSPDGGDGSLEVLYVAVVVVIGLAIMFRSRIRQLVGRGPSAGSAARLRRRYARRSAPRDVL
jgi:hypothetical protein